MLLACLLSALGTALMWPTAAHAGDDDEDAAKTKLRQAACQTRSPCELRWAKDAGKHGGHHLKVVELDLDPSLEPGPSYGRSCKKLEYWLLRLDDSAQISSRQLLLEACNDGYGARGMGEDGVAVEDNRFSHVRTGGSAWMWSAGKTLQLAPLRILEESTSGYWTLGPNTDSRQWSWSDFSGMVSWFAGPCNDQGMPAMGERIDRPAFTYQPIPLLHLPKAFRHDKWKTVSPEVCSARVDSAGHPPDDHRGFIVHGKPGEADDAKMRVVAGPQNELFVEVEDDNWVAEAKRWIHTDHLEIWTHGQEPGYMDHCLEDQARPEQWGITLDGQIHPAYGAPKNPPEVDVVHLEGADDSPARFKLTFPKPPTRITVVYSDSDDGKSQERLIATSKLKFGDPKTLGDVRKIEGTEAVCYLEDDQMKLELFQEFEADEPAISY